jgi:hypothetical protein
LGLHYGNRYEKKYLQGYVSHPIKTPFDEQLQRIKDKLVAAKTAGEDLDVFDASTHEYLLGVPATGEEVSAFEKKHSIARLHPDIFTGGREWWDRFSRLRCW